ncbi:hypothetical protein HNO88_000508 [Novosphingobium chloroacetimidivorans]|uniref:Phage tail tape measure protein n=1 Tax=Novosphingobium chloroacetimidivorans TaxID=1428314 RepID=A0A7W7K6Q7_9SPHN|nr:hypothetical protein [Novosphingobium chloroacetimidivorans]MBB4857201.1 hypothetical protein [Novosphingobium chloroacetimidivorans]
MGGTIARLNAALTWDLDDFDNGTNHIGGAFQKVREMVSGLGDAFASAGRKMTLAVSGPLTAFGGYALKTASDAQELQSAFDYTFGAMAGTMNKWAKDTGDSMGRSTHAMQEGALAFGQLFKVAAANGPEMAKLSQHFAVLAQDASSFFNVPYDVAMGKLRAGLTGESEPLRDFGVFLNEAAVEAEGLRMGLIKSGQELNENGKIMARASLIAKGMADASGDVERTSGSLANRWRALTERLSELATEIGERLIPIAEKLLGWADRMLAKLQELPDWVKDLAFQFVLFSAALGPALLAISAIAAVALPLFLSRMGPVLMILSAIINPLGTAVVMLAKLSGSFGLVGAVIGRFAPMLLRLAGPIGVAIGLFIMFSDRITSALRDVLSEAREALGPRLEAMFGKLGDLVDTITRGFDRMAASPIGQFISRIIGLLGDLIEWLVEVGGSAVIQAIGAAVDTINTMLDAVNGLAAVAQLVLMGQWSDAWAVASSVVQSSVGRIIQSIAALFPPLQAAIWLMEKAGLISESKGSGRGLQKAASYTAKDLLGPDAPAANDNAGGVTSYAEAEGPAKAKKSRAGRSGPTAQELADRREELRLQHELDIAREKGDTDAERSIQRQIDLKRAASDYERAGLSRTQARAAAEKDIAEMDEARAVAQAKMLATDERQFNMQLAELRGDYENLRFLRDEEFIEREIERLKRSGITLAQAEIEAQNNLKALEQARADAAARRLADQQAAHDIELSRLRGDSDAVIRAKEEADRIRQRTLDLRGDGEMGEEDARAKAIAESMDRERATMTGTFRDSFREGLRAAMDGNLGDFFENWMKERTFNALANVLDRLATNLADMVFNMKQGGSSGGFLGGLFNSVGNLFGGGSSGLSGVNYGAITDAANNVRLPGFANTGSFQIRGFPGIDSNLLSVNGNPVARVSTGEIVNVRRNLVEGGGGRAERSIVELRVQKGQMFEATVETISGGVVTRAAPSLVDAGARSGAALVSQRNSRRVG